MIVWWPIALLVATLVWGRFAAQPAVVLTPAIMLAPAPRRLWWGRVLPAVLRSLAVLSVSIALARPVTVVETVRERVVLDVALCLDVSSSMRQQDLAEGRSRLDVARAAARGFVAGRPDDRIALATFAAYVDLRCPATTDHATLREVLDRVTLVAEDGPEDQTGIGNAVASCAVMLEEARPAVAGMGDSVLVLLTDGKENVAVPGRSAEISPARAGQMCEQFGVRVYTIVVGAQVAGAPGARSTAAVRRLAERTGGTFFEVLDDERLNEAFTSIDQLERSRRSKPEFATVEWSAVFVWSGVLLWLAGTVLAIAWRSAP